jgi:hypothetical protein
MKLKVTETKASSVIEEESSTIGMEVILWKSH